MQVLGGLSAKIGAQILIGQLFVLHFRKLLENTVERSYLHNVNFKKCTRFASFALDSFEVKDGKSQRHVLPTAYDVIDVT